jgi:hypothetical protein
MNISARSRAPTLIRKFGDIIAMSDSKSKEKKTRNPEGEAQAQWREEDLDFGGKKKQMLGSDGQIISLEDGAQSDEKQAPFKATMCGTEMIDQPYMLNMLTSSVAMYKFELCFGSKDGGRKWEIQKRYSDFDRLDNRVFCPFADFFNFR